MGSRIGGVQAPPPEDGGTMSMMREACRCCGLACISPGVCLSSLLDGHPRALLQECHGFCEPAFAGEAGGLDHVDLRLCVHGFDPGGWAKRGLALPSGRVGQARKTVGRVLPGGQRMRSLSAALTAGTGVQGAEHMNGGDGLAGEFGRDIGGDDGEPENLDVKRLAGRLHGLQVLPAVVAQAQVELVSRRRIA